MFLTLDHTLRKLRPIWVERLYQESIWYKIAKGKQDTLSHYIGIALEGILLSTLSWNAMMLWFFFLICLKTQILLSEFLHLIFQKKKRQSPGCASIIYRNALYIFQQSPPFITWLWFNIMRFYLYIKSHCGDTTVVRAHLQWAFLH